MKLSYNQLKKILLTDGLNIEVNALYQLPFFGFYHAHEWDHGYESSYGFKGKRREFYSDMNECISLILEYISYYAIEDVIIAPFHKVNQFSIKDKNNDIYLEIRDFLRDHDIRLNSQSGVALTVKGNQQIIDMVVEGNLRGISELSFYFPKSKTIISPNHHFDFSFHTNFFDTGKEILLKLLSNSNNLKYYEKHL